MISLMGCGSTASRKKIKRYNLWISAFISSVRHGRVFQQCTCVLKNCRYSALKGSSGLSAGYGLRISATFHDSDEFAEVVVREKLAHQIFISQVHYASHALHEATDQVTNVVQLGERVLLVLLFQLGKDVQKVVKISVFLGVTFTIIRSTFLHRRVRNESR